MKHSFLDTIVKMVIMIVVAITTVIGTLITLTVVTVLGLGVFGLAASGSITEKTFETAHIYGDTTADKYIVSVPVTGIIVGDDSDIDDPFGLMAESITYGYDIKKTLIESARDPQAAAIILEINSPGGTIYGSNAIADGIAYVKEQTSKPVFAFVSGLAASGGYWAAAGADEIFADTGTGIGSIGVISGPFQFYNGVVSQDGGAFVGGIVTEQGIETQYITAGRSKDLGNPYRRMTEAEIATLQKMVDNEYETFVRFISEKRNIPQDSIVNTIGALVYDTKQAQELGLIDSTANRENVYEIVAERAGLDNFKVVREEPYKGFLQTVLESRSFFSPVQISLCPLTKTQLVYHGDISRFCL